MKRTIVFLLLVSCAVTCMFAQGRNRQGQDFPPGRQQHFSQERRPTQNRPAPVSTSVSGNLTIAQGMIAVTSDGITYLTGGLNRFTGFIDGLKEGAVVTLEGFAMPNPHNDNIQFLRVQKMTLNGKEYDLAMPFPNSGPRQNISPYQNTNPHPRASPQQNTNPRPRASPQQQRRGGKGNRIDNK